MLKSSFKIANFFVAMLHICSSYGVFLQNDHYSIRNAGQSTFVHSSGYENGRHAVVRATNIVRNGIIMIDYCSNELDTLPYNVKLKFEDIVIGMWQYDGGDSDDIRTIGFKELHDPQMRTSIYQARQHKNAQYFFINFEDANISESESSDSDGEMEIPDKRAWHCLLTSKYGVYAELLAYKLDKSITRVSLAQRSNREMGDDLFFFIG